MAISNTVLSYDLSAVNTRYSKPTELRDCELWYDEGVVRAVESKCCKGIHTATFF